MAIFDLNKQLIEEAIKYIDENGVPETNSSIKYEVVWDNGKLYPVKYLVAVAISLKNGNKIDVSTFNSIDAKKYLEKLNYNVQTKYAKYELQITAKAITSTDESFNINNLSAGDNFKPLEAFFITENGEEITRKYEKGEKRNCNQTLPRIAFQVFEAHIANLSEKEKKQFPICQYNPNDGMIRGIYYSEEDAKSHNINPFNTLSYKYGNGKKFVIYCWNIFSTIIFVQECLKRFGKEGAFFKLIYRAKDKKESVQDSLDWQDNSEENNKEQCESYRNPYSKILLESKNIIFRGSPGTGKTYLAKEIATDIISNGYLNDYTMLTTEQKQQIEFVQFHPSYDYSDFVEGLRPRIKDEDGTIGLNCKQGCLKNC